MITRTLIKSSGHILNLKKSDHCGISSLEQNHQVVTDNLGKANILNYQFASVFTVDNDDNEQIPALKTSTCPDAIEQQYANQSTTFRLPKSRR